MLNSQEGFGDSTTDLVDRRANRRFPLRLEVKYRLTGTAQVSTDWIDSESLNISSTGLLFSTAEACEPGQCIEACVAWPVHLDRRIPLKLVIRGFIVRTVGDKIAIRFDKHEFKTRIVPKPEPEPLKIDIM